MTFSGYVIQNSTTLDQEESFVAPSSNQGSIDASEYDEIDQIYDYIRGIGSLPRNMNFNHSTNEQVDAIVKTARSHRGSEQKMREKKLFNSKNLHKSEVACDAVGSFKSGQFHPVNDNPSLQWIRHNYIEKPIPASIRTIPSKLKQTVVRRPALIIGKTNISTGQKVSTSLQDCHQSPLFDIR